MFGDRLRELRKNVDLSQEQLGKVLNVSANAIYSWEAGRTQPSIEMLISIAKYFNVTVDYLLDSSQEDLNDEDEMKKWLIEVGHIKNKNISEEDFAKIKAIIKVVIEQYKNKD